MNFVISFILNLIVIAIGSWLGHWWVIFIASFVICGIINKKELPSFLSGFSSVFILWFVLSWYVTKDNGQLLLERMTSVFHVGYPIVLITITSLFGGLCGGMSALVGRTFMNLLGIRKEHQYRW